MRKQVELWRQSELTDVTAKIIIYQAFIESELEIPRHLPCRVHGLYFDPQYDEFKARAAACRTHSRPRLKIWIRFRSSGQQPSSVVSWKLVSGKASEGFEDTRDKPRGRGFG